MDAPVSLYFDHAATSPIDPEVRDVLVESLSHYGNASSLHRFGREAKARIEWSRKRIADELGLNSSEVVFNSGATEAIYSLLHHYIYHLGIVKVYVSALEHSAVLDSLSDFKQRGKVEICFFENDESGRLLWNDLPDSAFGPGVLWLAMLYNNEIGNRNPIEKMAERCFETQTALMCDAVQGVGLDLPDMNACPGIDAMVFSGHKFNGPKGIGLSAIRRRLRYTSLFKGGAQERGMRSGTENTAAIEALGKAWELARSRSAQNRSKLLELRALWLRGIEERNWALNGDYRADDAHPGILNLRLPYRGRTSVLLFKLDLEGLSVSEGSACTSGSSQGSHVVRALGAPRENTAHIRISMGRDNRAEEVLQALQIIDKVLGTS